MERSELSAGVYLVQQSGGVVSGKLYTHSGAIFEHVLGKKRWCSSWRLGTKNCRESSARVFHVLAVLVWRMKSAKQRLRLSVGDKRQVEPSDAARMLKTDVARKTRVTRRSQNVCLRCSRERWWTAEFLGGRNESSGADGCSNNASGPQCRPPLIKKNLPARTMRHTPSSATLSPHPVDVAVVEHSLLRRKRGRRTDPCLRSLG